MQTALSVNTTRKINHERTEDCYRTKPVLEELEERNNELAGSLKAT